MDMSINKRLEKFLFEKDISQEKLRIKLGLKTRQQVSNWINCHDPIPDKHVLAIFFNGLMAVPNLLALLALSGVVAGIARNKKD